MLGIETKILQELIYERVRQSVNLCQLVILEQELDKSIRRAMGGHAGSGQSPDALARGLMNEAWQRLEREWDELRDNLTMIEEDYD